jgi:hypothetical protein
MNNKQINIKIDDWDYTCGDGCCYEQGSTVYLNGEELIDVDADSGIELTKAILIKLGFIVNITK